MDRGVADEASSKNGGVDVKCADVLAEFTSFHLLQNRY